MRRAFLASGLLAALSASPVSAMSITWDPTNTLNPGEELVATFEGLTPGTALPGSGTNAFAYNSDISGTAILPRSASNPGTAPGYGAVLRDGSWTYNFAGAMQVFSFWLGGLDSYNSVTLNFAQGSSVTYTGTQLGNLFNVATNGTASGRLRFDRESAPGITSVTLGSTQNSIEFDDFAVAAPEPATWAMMIFGFGAAGASLRRRRRSNGVAYA